MHVNPIYPSHGDAGNNVAGRDGIAETLDTRRHTSRTKDMSLASANAPLCPSEVLAATVIGLAPAHWGTGNCKVNTLRLRLEIINIVQPCHRNRRNGSRTSSPLQMVARRRQMGITHRRRLATMGAVTTGDVSLDDSTACTCTLALC